MGRQFLIQVTVVSWPFFVLLSSGAGARLAYADTNAPAPQYDFVTLFSISYQLVLGFSITLEPSNMFKMCVLISQWWLEAWGRLSSSFPLDTGYRTRVCNYPCPVAEDRHEAHLMPPISRSDTVLIFIIFCYMRTTQQPPPELQNCSSTAKNVLKILICISKVWCVYFQV